MMPNETQSRRTFFGCLSFPFVHLILGGHVRVDSQALILPAGAESQSLTFVGMPDAHGELIPQPVGGTFRLSCEGVTSRKLAFDATPADVDQAVMEMFPAGIPPWLKGGDQ